LPPGPFCLNHLPFFYLLPSIVKEVFTLAPFCFFFFPDLSTPKVFPSLSPIFRQPRFPPRILPFTFPVPFPDRAPSPVKEGFVWRFPLFLHPFSPSLIVLRPPIIGFARFGFHPSFQRYFFFWGLLEMISTSPATFSSSSC